MEYYNVEQIEAKRRAFKAFNAELRIVGETDGRLTYQLPGGSQIVSGPIDNLRIREIIPFGHVIGESVANAVIQFEDGAQRILPKSLLNF